MESLLKSLIELIPNIEPYAFGISILTLIVGILSSIASNVLSKNVLKKTHSGDILSKDNGITIERIKSLNLDKLRASDIEELVKKVADPLEQSILKRLEEAKIALEQQSKLSKINRFASTSLTIGQFIIGGLLTAGFLQNTVSPIILGFLGLVVLLSTLIRQHFKPDVKASNASKVETQLKILIRKAEDELTLIQAGSPSALPKEKLLKDLTEALTRIDLLILDDTFSEHEERMKVTNHKVVKESSSTKG